MRVSTKYSRRVANIRAYDLNCQISSLFRSLIRQDILAAGYLSIDAGAVVSLALTQTV